MSLLLLENKVCLFGSTVRQSEEGAWLVEVEGQERRRCVSVMAELLQQVVRHAGLSTVYDPAPVVVGAAAGALLLMQMRSSFPDILDQTKSQIDESLGLVLENRKFGPPLRYSLTFRSDVPPLDIYVPDPNGGDHLAKMSILA